MRGEVSRSLSSIRKFTASISSSNSLLSSSVSHSSTESSDFRSPVGYFAVGRSFKKQYEALEFTVKCKRVAIAEVYKSRKSFDPVPKSKKCLYVRDLSKMGIPLGEWRVFELDHLNSILVALVVNVLQLGNDLVAGEED